MATKEEIMNYLQEVFDPEVPVLSVVDLGIIRKVEVDTEGTTITITPTYTGCPAMNVIEEDIRTKLTEKGISNFNIKTIISPAWTTDWISEEGKKKLEAYGIAPPEKTSLDISLISNKPKTIKCPRCGSLDTEMKSFFGSTACKALYVCNSCKEPFDYFKCL
ncbi:MAG TPA: 1,2-phenylacetyl-CoA epoxidase subunit PaaD [Bacteroidia bacterium]|jgi:ring-1,2-phenylacetyl-CoA epoxidase subunit PaaD|nr:1,2-phenylacetyl-CoA epoxidase subunit PaaD [Bacteroidia bacterium]